ncbi:hypothetical protein BH10ACT11_BH10ACT11_21870 [soil metagenome]
MAITAGEAKQQILDDLGTSIDHTSLAVACLGEAFDLLPEASGDRIEAEPFRPVPTALGRAKRTHSGFAQRSGIAPASFETPSAGLPSQGVKTFIERSVQEAIAADNAIAELQDSMLPIESGDPELRANLSEVRELLAELPVHARQFLRTLGR